MSKFFKNFLNNVGQGLGNPKGTLGDFAHAARLYNDQSMRLAPKTKFLYHVVFNLNPRAVATGKFDIQKHSTAINMLVKAIELPKFKITVDRPQQYNRKKAVQTKLEYEPITVTFHDDNFGLTTNLWAMYYGYYFSDSKHGGSAGSSTAGALLSGLGNMLSNAVPALGGLVGRAQSFLGSDAAGVPAAYQRNTFQMAERNKFRYGLDSGASVPFFSSIQIFQLARHQYQSYTLINPIITSWQHESLNASSNEVSQNTMSVAYEAVIYGAGQVRRGIPKTFATNYYDHQPSPLGILGGGTTSLFGQGGILGGIASILGDLGPGGSGFTLGTVIKGINVYKNSKKLTKEGVRQEGFNILKSAIGASTGIDVSGVANTFFPKKSGTAQQVTRAAAPVEKSKKNTPDQRKTALGSNPAAKAALTDLAIKSGVVPAGAGAAAAVDNLVNSGRNNKLNDLADKVISTAG
jgi:hypothetical protein